jgi:hypothetical protein
MHRKDNRKALLARHIAIMAALAATAAGLLFVLFATASPAASASTGSRLRADTQTCADFWAWGRHPSPKAFMALVDESRKADDYLRVDVRGLAHAEHVHAIIAIELARGYVAMDCTFTGDEGD